MSYFGSVKKCYLCILKENVRLVLLGENHAIRDESSDLARLFLKGPLANKNIRYYMEQSSEPLCRKFSTLDKLACSPLCEPNTPCRIDLREQIVRRLVSSRATATKPAICAILDEYDNNRVAFLNKFVSLISATDPETRYDTSILKYAARRVWKLVRRVLSLDVNELSRGRLVDSRTGKVIYREDVRRTLRTLSFVPVQDTIVYYHILASVKTGDKRPIVYVAGETHIAWLLKLLEPLVVSSESLDASADSCARIGAFFE